jgi:hypothetical protein
MIVKVIQKRVGLGDLVSVFAEPIAKASDATFGTHLVGCGGCQKRRESLNEAVPNVNPLANNEFATQPNNDLNKPTPP